jgi:hypothetical protein
MEDNKKAQNTSQNVEERTADAILQKPIEVRIGKKTYQVPRPTLATIIEVSAMIAEYKDVEYDETPDDPVSEVLRVARHYDGMERILAMIVLGAKAARKEYKVFGFTVCRSHRLDKLARVIKETLTPQDITEMLIKVFGTMDVAFFLVSITSLHRVNHLKATKGTTASGRQPQAS